MKQFVFLSGLPRSGSTLLSAILSQNPLIHAEGNSAVCQLMWDMQQSCEINALEQIAANNRFATQNDLISTIPAVYYKNTDKPIVVDKCRSWTLPANMAMIRRYITDKPKVIVLTRQLGEVVNSFISLNKRNGFDVPADSFLEPHSEPVMRSNDGVEYARANNNGEFLFIDYQDLCDYPVEVLSSIYSFCGWESFQHDFDNVVNNHSENDAVYGLVGMHDIRAKVGKI
jgi:sulfotransferase